MQSGTFACYGHMLKLTDHAIEQLNVNLSKYDKELKEYAGNHPKPPSTKEFLKYLWGQTDLDSIECTVGGKKIMPRLYYFDGDCVGPYDDLESDTFYLEFNESDLVIKTQTETAKILSEAEILPEFMAWIDYG